MEDLFWGLIGHATRTAGTRCRELRVRRDYDLVCLYSTRQKT